MGKDIKFKNRDGRTIILSLVEKNKYAFAYEDYVRVGFNDTKENDLCFIDPSGGPFMSVGGMLDEQNVISRIYDDKSNQRYIIETNGKV